MQHRASHAPVFKLHPVQLPVEPSLGLRWQLRHTKTQGNAQIQLGNCANNALFERSVQRSGRKSHTLVYLATIRVRVRAGSGYIVKYRLPDLQPCIQHPVTGPLDTSLFETVLPRSQAVGETAWPVLPDSNAMDSLQRSKFNLKFP